MREIKFRAWDTVRKKLWSAEEMGRDELAINPDGRGFANIHSRSTKLSHYLKHLIPLQYTGLKDKNGKEIYEGDIVQFGNGRGRVYYNDKICAYGVIGYWESWERARVVGNIYENPELLK